MGEIGAESLLGEGIAGLVACDEFCGEFGEEFLGDWRLLD